MSDSTNTSPEKETWPRKLNKLLIAVGVLAFGLIVTDRILETKRASESPVDELASQTAEPVPETNEAVEPVVESTVQPVVESTVQTVVEQVANQAIATDSESTENVAAVVSDAESATTAIAQEGAEALADVAQKGVSDLVPAEATKDLSEVAQNLTAVAGDGVNEPLVESALPLEESVLQEKIETAMVSVEALTAQAKPAVGEATPLSLENVFGSRLVFVSASQPGFVLTETAQRFDVGAEIQEGVVLASVSVDEITLQQDSEQTVLALPKVSQ